MVCALLSTGNERNWPTFKWQNGRSVRRSQGRRGPSKRQNVTVYICGMPCLNQVIGTQICPPRINRLRWNPGCKLQRWGYTAVLCCDAGQPWEWCRPAGDHARSWRRRSCVAAAGPPIGPLQQPQLPDCSSSGLPVLHVSRTMAAADAALSLPPGPWRAPGRGRPPQPGHCWRHLANPGCSCPRVQVARILNPNSSAAVNQCRL